MLCSQPVSPFSHFTCHHTYPPFAAGPPTIAPLMLVGNALTTEPVNDASERITALIFVTTLAPISNAAPVGVEGDAGAGDEVGKGVGVGSGDDVGDGETPLIVRMKDFATQPEMPESQLTLRHTYPPLAISRLSA